MQAWQVLIVSAAVALVAQYALGLSFIEGAVFYTIGALTIIFYEMAEDRKRMKP